MAKTVGFEPYLRIPQNTVQVPSPAHENTLEMAKIVHSRVLLFVQGEIKGK